MWIFSHIITTQAERSFGSCFSSISLGDLQSKKGTSVICLAVFNACPFYSILESNQIEGVRGREQKIAEEEEEESDCCATPEELESVMSH